MNRIENGVVKIPENSGSSLTGAAGRTAPGGAKNTAHHPHPVQPGSLVKREKAVTSVKPGTEGCDEHYNERELVFDLNFAPEEQHPSAVASNLLKTMLIGEALANPRFKNPFPFKK